MNSDSQHSTRRHRLIRLFLATSIVASTMAVFAAKPEIAQAEDAIGPFSNACVDDIPLDAHFGPAAGQPYGGSYTGSRNAAGNIVIDPSDLYATNAFASGYSDSPVDRVNPSNVPLLFRDDQTAVLRNLQGSGAWTGATGGSELTTMALDGGGPGSTPRAGKSYFWNWAGGTTTAGGTVPSNAISIAEVLNNSDGSLSNNTKPTRILHVPQSTIGHTYWSGGEVNQHNGYIYFTDGEDDNLGGTNNAREFQLMVYDPATGNYARAKSLRPKTLDDNKFDNSYPASDLVIDGKGDAYMIVRAANAQPPSGGNSVLTNWLVKVEIGKHDQDWYYSAVTPLWMKSGTNFTRVYSAGIWGMAFHDGKLYASGINASGSELVNHLVAIDPLTGYVTHLGAAGNDVFDLAAADTAPILNGAVYHDSNRNGVKDGSEVGVADQIIELYDESGKAIGKQTTNASGEYTFIMPDVSNMTKYHVRLAQPQLTVNGGKVNAVQTGISVPGAEQANPCGINTAQPQSYGENINRHQAPGLNSDGKYIDYPAQFETPSPETLVTGKMLLSAEITVRTAMDVTSVNFGVDATGDWGDAGKSVITFNSRALENGPRHIPVGGSEAKSDVKLGSSIGSELDGAINNSHKTDDGVVVLADGHEVSPEEWIFVPGKTYEFKATVAGDKADEATVRAWLSTRNANSFAETAPSFVSRAGSGTFTMPFAATPAPNTTGTAAFLRVNASSTSNDIGSKHHNGNAVSNMPYAPAQGSTQSKTAEWVVDGETEDYAIALAAAVLRIQVEGAPGSYTFGLSNVSNTAPSSNTSIGTVPSNGAAEILSSHAVTSTSAVTTVTVSTLPDDASVISVTLVDEQGIEVPGVTWNPDTKQVSLPTSVWNSSRDLTLKIATQTSVAVKGLKLIAEITYGVLPSEADATDFQILATSEGESGIDITNSARLTREVSYKIGERLIDSPSIESSRKYVHDSTRCLDKNGDPLPEGVFDPETNILTPDDTVNEIHCSVTNSAAEVTLLPTRVGDGEIGVGWGVDMAFDGDGTFDADLNDAVQTAVVRPGTYSLDPFTPDGIFVAGLQYLDLGDPECAAGAADPDSIADSCWIRMDGSQRDGFELEPGTHHVIRLVGVSIGDLPLLPLTGGVGAWIYTLFGLLILAIASAIFVIRRRTRK